MKLLFIEDETELGKSVTQLLKKEAYHAEWVKTYREAMDRLSATVYDCLLIDITLPDGNGLNILRQQKESWSDAGIILITAKNSINDRVEGLDLGADDYISKPFHLAELNSRIKAVLRRRKFAGSKEIEFNNLRILPERYMVFAGEKLMDFTRKEFELLMFLVSNKNRVVTREAIAEHIWGDYMATSDTYDFIYSHIKNIRRKLSDCGSGDTIHSIYGIGYKITGN